jgi:hypothetical protein
LNFNELRKIAWERYKIIGAIMGDIIGRVIATVFYFTILVPFGIISRLFTDPLYLRPEHMKPSWIEREPVENQLESALRQG